MDTKWTNSFNKLAIENQTKTKQKRNGIVSNVNTKSNVDIHHPALIYLLNNKCTNIRAETKENE